MGVRELCTTHAPSAERPAGVKAPMCLVSSSLMASMLSLVMAALEMVMRVMGALLALAPPPPLLVLAPPPLLLALVLLSENEKE